MPARRAAASKSSALGQRVASVVAGRRGQVAVQVEERRARDVALAPQRARPPPARPASSGSRRSGCRRRQPLRSHAADTSGAVTRCRGSPGGSRRPSPCQPSPGASVSPCARWCSSVPASRSGRRTCPSPSPGRARCCSRCGACGVCRTDLHIVDGELTEPKLPLVPGHQIVGRVAGGRRAVRAGRARGRALARLDRRRLPLLPLGPREPLRPRALHRLRHRRRLRRARGGRRALLLPAPGRLRRRPGRAAPVRRPDRLPDAAAGRRRRAARHLRLRRGRAHHRPGGAPPGAARVRLHARGRRGGAAVRARAGRRVGGRLARAAARGARRRAHLRAGRRARAGRAAGRGEGRHGRLRRHPHERHPGVPLRAAVGRAGAPLGRQPHARGRRGVPRAGARGCRCGRRWRRSRSRRRTRRSTGSAPGTCAARRCSCCDPGVPRAHVASPPPPRPARPGRRSGRRRPAPCRPGGPGCTAAEPCATTCSSSRCACSRRGR